MPVPDIPPGERGYLHPDQMRLHSGNPRFAAVRRGHEDVSEADAIETLYRYADLEELLQSIAANQYIGIEPLIVLRRDDAYVVIEGNRRLAAAKLLLNAELGRAAGITVPEIDDGVRESLQKIEVLAVASEREARQFIGFKHINGPHKWDSFSKGKFAAEWYASERDNGVTLKDIARMLGDRHDTVQRLVHGIFILDQADEAGIFSLEDRFGKKGFSFSHLYTALTRPGFRSYLGLDANWRKAEPWRNPVPADHVGNLGEALKWLYGYEPEGIAPVVLSQNPHVKQLSEVLENKVAIATLRARANLREAYAEVRTQTVVFTEAMATALQAAQKAAGSVYDVDEPDEATIDLSRRLHKVSTSIWEKIASTAGIGQ